MPALLQAVAEAVGAEHGVGMNDDAIAQDGAVVQHHIRVQHHVVAEHAVAADRHPTVNAATLADDGPGADCREGGDAGLGAEPDARIDGGARIDAARRRRRPPVKALGDGGERGQRIGSADHRLAGDGHVVVRDDRRGSAGLQLGKMSFLIEERDVAGLSLVQRPRGLNHEVAVAFDLALYQLGQLPHGDAHGKHPFFP